MSLVYESKLLYYTYCPWCSHEGHRTITGSSSIPDSSKICDDHAQILMQEIKNLNKPLTKEEDYVEDNC